MRTRFILAVFLTVGDFQVETLEHDGRTYQKVTIPDMVQTAIAGEPQVPTRGALLGLPTNEGVSVRVLEAHYETLAGYRLYPVPGLEWGGDELDIPPAGKVLRREVRRKFLFIKTLDKNAGHKL